MFGGRSRGEIKELEGKEWSVRSRSILATNSEIELERFLT